MEVDITACGRRVVDDQAAKCPRPAGSHRRAAGTSPSRHFSALADGFAEALGEALGAPLVRSAGLAARIVFSRFLALSSVELRSSDCPLRNTVGVPVTLRVFSAKLVIASTWLCFWPPLTHCSNCGVSKPRSLPQPIRSLL